jgi:hypothetical protein
LTLSHDTNQAYKWCKNTDWKMKIITRSTSIVLCSLLVEKRHPFQTKTLIIRRTKSRWKEAETQKITCEKKSSPSYAGEMSRFAYYSVVTHLTSQRCFLGARASLCACMLNPSSFFSFVRSPYFFFVFQPSSLFILFFYSIFVF